MQVYVREKEDIEVSRVATTGVVIKLLYAHQTRQCLWQKLSIPMYWMTSFCASSIDRFGSYFLNKEGTCTREGGDLWVSTGRLGWGFAKIPAVNLRSVARS